MADFKQRDSGYWQARIRRKGWPVQSKTFQKKSLAEAWARKVEESMDRGSFISSSAAEQTTLKDLVERFKKEYAPHHYRGQSWEVKLTHLERRLGNYSLVSITPERVTQYRDARLKDPDSRFKNSTLAPRVSGATVKTELDMLSKLLEVCVKEFSIYLPNGNPVASIRKPTDNKARDRRLTNSEFEALIEAAGRSSNIWLKPAILISVETAMRQGEMLGLRWENVSLEKQVAFLKTTKNGEARGVPLSSRCVALIQGLPRLLDGRVIGQEKQGLYGAFKTACRRAKIENFTWHDLRHEALSRLAERGDLSVLELSAISGHKTLRLVQMYVQMHASTLAQKLG